MKYAASIIMILGLAGCHPSAKLDVTSSEAETRHLNTQAAHYDIHPDGQTALLIKIPANADTAPVAVYMTYPTGDGTFVHGDGGTLEGLVVTLEDGEWTSHDLADASLEVGPLWHHRQGDFAATCADGLEVSGSFVARMSTRHVREFENRFTR